MARLEIIGTASELRDITESDPGRGGRGARLAVIALAGTILAGTAYLGAAGSRSGSAPPPEPAPARSVGLLGAAFPDYMSGWLLTGDGTAGGKLWRTADGGQTWSLAIQLGRDSSFGRLGLGTDAGYLATVSLPQGKPGSRWLNSSDEGRTFDIHPFPDPAGYLLQGVASTPDGADYALFGDEMFPPTALFYARDAAQDTWIQVAVLQPRAGEEEIPLLGDRTTMAFLDRRHGFIATTTDIDNPAVYVTADGGRIWNLQRLTVHADEPPQTVAAFALNGVMILTAAYAAATDDPDRRPARSVMYMSYDAGATWSGPDYLPTKDGMEAPALAESDVWWVPMGSSVSVTKDAGADWLVTGLRLPARARVEAVYPVDERRAWAFAGAGSGPPQLLFETSDGGATWSARRPPA